MRSILPILVGVFSIALVKAHSQPSDAEKWHVVGPLSDVENTMIYQAERDFGGKHFESQIYGRDLQGITKWEPEKELPISMSKIVAKAQDAFRKQFPQYSQFKLMSVDLLHLTIADEWIVNVEFNGTDFAAVGSGSFEEKRINVLVLLNGRVITPTETAK